MNILLCHNYYQYRGGEDESFEAEAQLLESRGHEVHRFTLHNDSIREAKLWRVTAKSFWNRQAYTQLTALIRRLRPQIMHCTNTFPLLSPAIYYAARNQGVPVIQSLRNYRLLCVNSFFFRDGSVCETCLGKSFAWPGVLHGCYRNSRPASAIVAAMTAAHRWAGTWSRAVDYYFTPSEFARSKYVEAGFPADRISVKPNFVFPDPLPGDGSGGYAVFAGRLSEEKGVGILLDAWSRVGIDAQLKIIGEGPMSDRVRQAAETDPRIQWLGHLPAAEVLSMIGRAACLVMPSIWYETFGRTIIEAYAKGTPVVVSDSGAMREIVDDGRTGFRFPAGDADRLAARLTDLLRVSDAMDAMRREARQEYETRFSADRNYSLMMDIYRRAVPLPQGTDTPLDRETEVEPRCYSAETSGK